MNLALCDFIIVVAFRHKKVLQYLIMNIVLYLKGLKLRVMPGTGHKIKYPEALKTRSKISLY